jgi:hypothetical protein
MIDRALAEREKVARLIYEHRPSEMGLACACGWEVDKTDAKVYEWQHRLHLADVLLAACANEALEKAAQHEPEWYCAAGPISGVNNTYTIAFYGCTCGWNSDGEAAKKETWGSHIRKLKAEG